MHYLIQAARNFHIVVDKNRLKWPLSFVFCISLLLLVQAICAHDNICTDHASPYMVTHDGKFCFEGETVYLYGATFYPYWDHGGVVYRSKGWLRADFKTYIDTILDHAQNAGLNTLRPTDYLNNAYFWDYAIVWENMDYLIQQAEARDMWIILDLSTYGHWLENHHTGDVYDAENWKPLLQFIGQRYQDSKSIAHYSLLGEIPDSDTSGASPDEYIGFYRDLLQELHTNDNGNHLISIGGLLHLNYDSGIPWEVIYDLPYNDIASLHIYSDGDRDVSLPKVFTWAHNNQVPLLIEEFGFQQSRGDRARAESFQSTFELFDSYDVSGTLFWNLGPELNSNSHDIGPQTPELWQVIQANAP